MSAVPRKRKAENAQYHHAHPIHLDGGNDRIAGAVCGVRCRHRSGWRHHEHVRRVELGIAEYPSSSINSNENMVALVPIARPVIYQFAGASNWISGSFILIARSTYIDDSWKTVRI